MRDQLKAFYKHLKKQYPLPTGTVKLKLQHNVRMNGMVVNGYTDYNGKVATLYVGELAAYESVLETIAHEYKHAMQFARGDHKRMDLNTRELEAYSFGRAAAAEWLRQRKKCA